VDAFQPVKRGTLLLSRRDVRNLLSPGDYLEAVDAGFRASKSGQAHSPPPLHIHAPNGGFHAKGALLSLQRSYVAIKLNGNFPGNPVRCGRPTIQGAIVLCDADDGAVLAIMDSIEITLMRTAAASALAARHLARSDARTLCVCGCGDQAPAQAAALANVLSLERGYAWDIDAEKAARFACTVSAGLGIPFKAVAELAPASRDSDVIVTCTTARTPFLTIDDASPGAFIAAVGADNPEKSEIAPCLMARSTVVVDVLEQCLVMGDLHHAVKAGVMSGADVHGELADILTGTKPGRTADDEIIVFDSTGTAIQDVASAALAYERAVPGKTAQFTFADT
jgi:ornithine cyclodeaminase/alanine dehydrogenase-like protein (mu-crystallin family)